MVKKTIEVNPILGVSGRQINRYLKKNVVFRGCFASNNIPRFKTFPFSLIINTNTTDQRVDGHWVSLYISKNYCLFFDSFGVPVLEKNILNYVSKYHKKVIYSNVCIQAIESVHCGLFCISFIKNVRNKKTFNDFVNKFNFVNLILNDKIVYENI